MNQFAIASALLLSMLVACGPGPTLRNATEWDAQDQLVDDQDDLARVTNIRAGLADARLSMDEQAFQGLEAELKEYLRAELSESSWEIDHADAEQADAIEAHRSATFSIAKEFRGLAGKRDPDSLDRADTLLGELVHLARSKMSVQRQAQLQLRSAPQAPRESLRAQEP